MAGQQPERVEFLPADINVRANWDHDIEYEMGSNDTFPAEEKQETPEETPGKNNSQQPSNFNSNPGNFAPSNNNQNNKQPKGGDLPPGVRN